MACWVDGLIGSEGGWEGGEVSGSSAKKEWVKEKRVKGRMN